MLYLYICIELKIFIILIFIFNKENIIIIEKLINKLNLMEFYNQISEFKPEYVFNKFDNDDKGYLYLEEVKHSFIYAFGKIVKKAEILDALKLYNKKNLDVILTIIRL